jgi:hypothetical protein
VVTTDDDSILLTVFVNADNCKALTSDRLVPAWACRGVIAGATTVIERSDLEVDLSNCPYVEDIVKDNNSETEGFWVSSPSLQKHPDLNPDADTVWEVTRSIPVTVKQIKDKNKPASKPVTMSSCFDYRLRQQSGPRGSTVVKKDSMLKDVFHLLK